MVNDGIHFSYQDIDSYDALFNFIVGSRGDGKTFGYKVKCVESAIRKGKAGAYIRRTQVELQDAISTWCNDILEHYPGYSFRVQGSTAYLSKIVNGEPDGIWVPFTEFFYLSNAKRKKSVAYPHVEHICLDEFMIEEMGLSKYLRKEVEAFLALYETISRMRDLKAYFLGNAFTAVNPYFLYFGMHTVTNKKGIKRFGNDIVLQIAKDDRYREAKRDTRFGKLIAGTDFAKSNIENEFIADTQEYIAKKGEKAYYSFTVFVDDEPFAVYRDMKKDLFFVSEDYNPEYPMTFDYKTKGKNSLAFASRRRFLIIDDFVYNFQNGNVRFETQKCKTIFFALMARIM